MNRSWESFTGTASLEHMSNFSIEKGLLNKYRFDLRDAGREFFRAFWLVQKKRDITEISHFPEIFLYIVNICRKSSPGIHIIAA